MVRTKEARLIYGQVSEVVTESISGDEMIKYLIGKKRRWTEDIMELVDWAAMGAYMRSIGGLRVTNVVKFAQDWQQIGLFYGGSEEIVCPIGCGKTEAHHHFLSCIDSKTIQSFR